MIGSIQIPCEMLKVSIVYEKKMLTSKVALITIFHHKLIQHYNCVIGLGPFTFKQMIKLSLFLDELKNFKSVNFPYFLQLNFDCKVRRHLLSHMLLLSFPSFSQATFAKAFMVFFWKVIPIIKRQLFSSFDQISSKESEVRKPGVMGLDENVLDK